MNIRVLPCLLLAALAPGAAAAPPQPAPIVVSCQQHDWPTLKRVAQEVGVTALDPVPRVRKRAILAGLRACRHGADDIVLVFDAARNPRIAQADAR
jgi:2-C-methyl-D-erythritol 4-phosphate cytidylyltransferase